MHWPTRPLLRPFLFVLLLIPLLSLGQTRRFGDESSIVHAARSRSYDVRNYVIKLALEYPERKIAGDVTITLNPLADGLSEVVVDSAELRIHKVEVDGRDANYRAAGDQLTVDLGRTYRASETIAIKVSYEGTPRKGLYWIGGDPAYPGTPMQIWSQGEDEDSRYWFPSYDFPNEKATSETYVTVKKPFSVVGNGRLVGIQDNGATRTFNWKMDVPHSTYLTSIAVGDFEVYKEKVGPVSVEYYVPRGTGREKTYRSFGMTTEAMRFFTEKIGIPYPYTKYAQIAVADFIFGGMENITATHQSAATLHDERAAIDTSSEGLVAHELAHQWWGNLVTSADWSHAWLHEGFATYFEALYRRKARGEDEFRYELYQNAQSYFNEDERSYRRPIVSALYTAPVDLFDSHMYDKGSLVLEMLHSMLGEDAFFKALNSYGTKFAQQSVTTDDFRLAVEETTGRNLERFFDQWLYRAGYPDLEVSWKWNNGVAEVTVLQKQKLDELTPLFDVPVVIDFMLANRQVKSFNVQIDKAEHTFSFPVPTRPVMVRFDPGNHVLKKLDFKKDKDELLFQAKSDPDVIGRIRAIDALARMNGDSQVVIALAEIIRSNAFAGVRLTAAGALGRLKGETALNALLQASKDREWRVRRAAVSALGEFAGSDRAITAIITALQTDKSYRVEAAAASALTKTRSDKAFDVLVAALAIESHNDLVRQSVLSALAEVGPKERVRPIILEWTAYGKISGTRSRAVSLLPKLADTDRNAITRRLIELLNDPWIFTRESAIGALGELRAEEALDELEVSANTEFDGRLRKEARDAMAQIRSGDADK